jgi:hypothetical protein
MGSSSGGMTAAIASPVARAAGVVSAAGLGIAQGEKRGEEKNESRDDKGGAHGWFEGAESFCVGSVVDVGEKSRMFEWLNLAD